jgi:ABC-2 type transport system ATP-binding protein
MADYVIETRGLTVFYGKHRGIEAVDLQVERGEVFGFLGPNGAGKTTTERVLLDIIRPSAGKARIFGLDCQKEGVAIRKRVGYLPGELSLYSNMKASQFFEMFSALQGHKGGSTYWRTLAERLELDTNRTIRQFSRGNKQKVGIVSAFMTKPDLLILDEPTGGVDPLVQQTVMEMVREVNREGCTVFFSSHILPEVQAVCDRVGIIREGRLVATERVEALTSQQFKRLRLSFAALPPSDAFLQSGVTELERTGQSVLLEVRENLNGVMEKATRYQLTDIETESVALEDIFLAYYGKENNHKTARKNGGNRV